jgi:hypothetical protein
MPAFVQHTEHSSQEPTAPDPHRHARPQTPTRIIIMRPLTR